MATKTAKFNDQTTATTNVPDGKTLCDCSALYAAIDEKETAISILFIDSEGNDGELRLKLLKWDENVPNARGTKGAYVVDAELLEETKAVLHDVFDVTIDDIKDNGTVVAGKEFQCYYNGERGSFSPIKTFITFEKKLDVKTQNILKRDYAMKDLELLPVDEWPGHRFNFGFAANIDGEIKNIRISQFIKPSEDVEAEDITVSVRYDGGKALGGLMTTRENMLTRDGLSEDDPAVKVIDERIARIKGINRSGVIADFKAVGIDVLDLIDTGEPIVIHGFEVAKFNDTAYIKAFL